MKLIVERKALWPIVAAVLRHAAPPIVRAALAGLVTGLGLAGMLPPHVVAACRDALAVPLAPFGL